jgi:dephospho-CoA kinase
MKKIGITGGIGSGKTIVCEVFKVFGIPVFHADAVARELQDSDERIRMKLIELFGTPIYLPNGSLDRKKLAGIIFNDPLLKDQVTQLVHPIVQESFHHWKSHHIQEDYILYEAAILFETGSYRNFDYTVLVVADEATRLKRVMKRDLTTPELILERIRNQMSDQEKIPLADFIIENDEKQLILPQILKLDQTFRK